MVRNLRGAPTVRESFLLEIVVQRIIAEEIDVQVSPDEAACDLVNACATMESKKPDICFVFYRKRLVKIDTDIHFG